MVTGLKKWSRAALKLTPWGAWHPVCCIPSTSVQRGAAEAAYLPPSQHPQVSTAEHMWKEKFLVKQEWFVWHYRFSELSGRKKRRKKREKKKEKRKKRRERKPSNLDSFSAGIFANEITFNIFRYPDKKWYVTYISIATIHSTFIILCLQIVSTCEPCG